MENNEQLCVQFDPDDKYVAVGYADGSIRIYSPINGQELLQMNSLFSPDKMPITGIR